MRRTINDRVREIITVVVKGAEGLLDVVDAAGRFQEIKQFTLGLLLNKGVACVCHK
jgi:hypothetical protein